MVGLAAGTFLLNFLLFRKVSDKSEDLIKADLMKEEIKRDRKGEVKYEGAGGGEDGRSLMIK